MKAAVLLFIFIIPILVHFDADNSFAVTAYEIEREYWKSRKDLSRKERLTKMDEAYTKRYGDTSGGGECCCVAIIIIIAVVVVGSKIEGFFIKNRKPKS